MILIFKFYLMIRFQVILLVNLIFFISHPCTYFFHPLITLFIYFFIVFIFLTTEFGSNFIFKYQMIFLFKKCSYYLFIFLIQFFFGYLYFFNYLFFSIRFHFYFLSLIFALLQFPLFKSFMVRLLFITFLFYLSLFY